MKRSELTAQSRFENSMRLINRGGRRKTYSIQAVTGTVTGRDPSTGTYSYTTASGVAVPVRNLSTRAYPLPRTMTAVITDGGNYVDYGG